MNADQKTLQEISEKDQLRLNELLLKHCGLHFPNSRKIELEHAIQQAFAASTCSSLDEYYELLSNPQTGTVEMDRLINAVTVNETHFFRDRAQFNALYNRILPQLIERRRPIRTLRIWSAGCSSGEEPYSLAIILRELLPDIDQWAITILGTDINTASLERARHATYGNWAFREERAKDLQARYFRPVDGRYELFPEVQRMVQFKRLNLVEPGYPSNETNTMLLDLILCRNVTIYFSEEITRWVVDRFYDALVDEGWLVVGHAEPSIDIYRRFHVRNFSDTTAYQKTNHTASLIWPQVNPIDPDPIPTPPLPVLDIRKAMATTPPPPPQAPSMILSEGFDSNDRDPLDVAIELLEYGRSDEARDILLKLVKDRPLNARVKALLGKTFANLSQWDEAQYWCSNAILCDKLLLEAYYIQALVLQHKGQFHQAIDSMKKVVYIDNTYILGYYGLANLYLENNRLPQAQKAFENALRLLQTVPGDNIVEGSNEITANRLRDAIMQQQRAWETG